MTVQRFEENPGEGIPNAIRSRMRILVLGDKTFFGGLHKQLSENHIVRLTAPKNIGSLLRDLLWADLVWVEWGVGWCSLIGQLNPPCKTVCRIHRYEIFERTFDWHSLSSFDHVFFVSNHMRECFLEKLGDRLPPKNTSVLYNGIDLNQFKYADRKLGFNLGAVAHVSYRKNFQMMAEIVVRLLQFDSRYKLHIIGMVVNGDCLDSFRAACRNLGVADQIVFDGEISHEDVPRWFEDKQYILSTSLHEGHPVGINEAMARGLKPIVYEYPGAEEVFPRSVLFKDIETAVRMIREPTYDSQFYHDWVARNFELRKQSLEVTSVLQNLFSEPPSSNRIEFLVRYGRWLGHKVNLAMHEVLAAKHFR
jgi:glycosyltransferase involved in cell wall biosynthesis